MSSELLRNVVSIKILEANLPGLRPASPTSLYNLHSNKVVEQAMYDEQYLYDIKDRLS